MWKRQYISKGGRLTLIRSTLSNMPIYYMSILRMPRSVRLRLKQIQRDFLWGGGALERKIYLVKWRVVCLDKSKGGLGVKCLRLPFGLPFLFNIFSSVFTHQKNDMIHALGVGLRVYMPCPHSNNCHCGLLSIHQGIQLIKVNARMCGRGTRS